MENSHNLVVINGGGRKSSAWLELPQTIIAPSTDNRMISTAYRVSGLSARKALEAGHRQPILDLWSMVYGEIPPVNDARIKWGSEDVVEKLSSINDSNACYRGIKRPIGDDNRGYDVYAYVNKPGMIFKYVPSLVCPIEPIEVGSDIVGVIYVKMDFPHGRTSLNKDEPATARGVITHWELVEADETGLLPIDANERYRKKMW